MSKTEADDLNLHVQLCAERYEGIQAEFGRLTNRMDKIDVKIAELQKDIMEGSKSLKTTIIGGAVTILGGLLSLALVLLMK